ncbi:MAG: hypothetical protein Ct9H300mP29_8570 [Candidatus Neomarinimicrobiota bacterium]|nr:MAG: hypothetical protein Ct9H300mP29_8570 [Candidatus Neomarinimicrobiota bacterium]
MHTIETKARKVHDVSVQVTRPSALFFLADLAGATIGKKPLKYPITPAGRVCEEVGVVPITLEMLMKSSSIK